MSGYIRDGIVYNFQDEVDLAAELPVVYLNGYPTDAGYIAEAVLASDWLAEHDRDVAARAWQEGYARGRYDKDLGVALGTVIMHENPYAEEQSDER